MKWTAVMKRGTGWVQPGQAHDQRNIITMDESRLEWRTVQLSAMESV